MKRYNAIVIILVLVNIGLITGYFLFFKQQKVVYVDNIELFNGFNFTKERQVEYEKQKNKFKGQLDTIRINHLNIEDAFLQNPNNKELENRLAHSYEYYQKTDHLYAVQLDSIDNHFNNEVWGKLNMYVTEYGKKNSYDIIIGASGTGTLMYGSDAYNITKDLIEYANHRYEGNE